jgi:hypothetical protein
LNKNGANSFEVLGQMHFWVACVGKHAWHERIWKGILCDSGGGRRMIYGHVATLVIAAAHVAISGHFVAAFHFCGRHCGIWQASEQWSGGYEEGDEKSESAAKLHS